jgi:hypothetical protein
MKALWRKLRETESHGGKPPLQQIGEAIRLRLRKSPVGISEYFEYGIWRRSITPTMTREFIGWRGSALLDATLNAPQSRVLANDKLINHMILLAAGLPCPLPIASFTAAGRRIGKEQVLRTLDEVREFLKGEVYPFYVKPISAGYGRGVLGVAGRDGDQFRLFDGSVVSLDDFLKPFSFALYCGMLFQKPLAAHPSVKELTGTDAVSCVRFICLVTPTGPVIHTAFWKITAGENMLDNFSHGDFGNCLGAIDLETGKIVRAISKMGADGEITAHPTTGKALIGFTLPDWGRAVALVKSASGSFPGLRLQNWDVALCPDGPVLLELNTESELAVPQAISGLGIMDRRLRDILAAIDRERLEHRNLLQGGAPA